MIQEYLYLNDGQDVKPVLDEMVDVIDKEQIGIKFEIIRNLVKTNVAVYRRGDIYYLQQFDSYQIDQDNQYKEIYNRSDLQKALLLVMQSCEESDNYDIVQYAV